MTRLMVVSDTHGDLNNLRAAVNEVLSKHEIDLFVHLGDEYQDAEVFDEYACQYIRVPGVYDDRYRDRVIPNRIMKVLEGWRFLMSHTDKTHSNDLPDDLRPEELIAGREIDVLLYGHSHQPSAEIRNEILRVNPGHLKKEDKRGFPPTYGIITITEERVRAVLQALGSGKRLGEAVLTRA
jgi:putative phosphoesterase